MQKHNQKQELSEKLQMLYGEDLSKKLLDDTNLRELDDFKSEILSVSRDLGVGNADDVGRLRDLYCGDQGQETENYHAAMLRRLFENPLNRVCGRGIIELAHPM